MRAGLSTIQQTLTTEASTVLNQSIAEAARRNHGQTTPLHVASTLLASPTGYLRQACIKSHPNSSHPLQCRALELCFRVALERLPTAAQAAADPPISNALMAALKRAQAHQRRGCPEQQQQPLLAVKVELEQLIISILDDPSVSRVMREASFSSPAVKATIEQSITSTSSVSSVSAAGSLGFGGGYRSSTVSLITPGSTSTSTSTNRNLYLNSRLQQQNCTSSVVQRGQEVVVPVSLITPGSANRNLYLNPRLQQQNGSIQQSGLQRGDEEVKRVVDILLRHKKRNPVLVGESEPEVVMKELIRKIESKELTDGLLKNVQLIHFDVGLDKAQLPAKIKELEDLIESKIENLILNLGDLKWLVEQPQGEAGKTVVAEMGQLLVKYATRVWLMGTATCETFLRCQVYHPSMEDDWDLQAVPIATRAPPPSMFPRHVTNNGILSSSVESLSPLTTFSPSTAAGPKRLLEILDPAGKISCCPMCMRNYEQELAKFTKESEKPSSEVVSEAAKPSLPQWLQNAKTQDGDSKMKDQELILNQKTQELQKKWNDSCSRLHPSFHKQSVITPERIVPKPISLTGMINPKLMARPTFPPKLQQNNKLLGQSLQLNPNLAPSRASERLSTLQASNGLSEKVSTPPRTHVRTDLLLGQQKVVESTPETIHQECVKDPLSCIPSEPPSKTQEVQIQTPVDPDSFKRVLKALTEKVWWQQDAASAVAESVTQCKLGTGKRSKGEVWLLFTGPDNIGKKKMASVLSDLVCGTSPITVSLSSKRRDDGEPNFSFRGRTALDRIVEAVRGNQFSVIVLTDIDEADMLVCGSIKRAMERGRLTDSHGREISLGNITFILTANWLPENVKFLSDGTSLDEKKLTDLASGGWQLKLSLCQNNLKRRPHWMHGEPRATRPRKDSPSGLGFDLNEAADVEDEKVDGSHNSSSLTSDHEEEKHGRNPKLVAPASSQHSRALVNSVDAAIAFKPVDFGPIRQDIATVITKKFSTVLGDRLSVEILDDALEKISSGLWLGQTGLDAWIEKVLSPSLHQLKSRLPSITEENTVRFELDNESDSRSVGDWLPKSINVVVDGL